MAKKVMTLIVLGFLTLYAIHSLLSLTEPPKSPDGLVYYKDTFQANETSFIVPLPVSCDYQWSSKTSVLTCNCEERWDKERVSHELIAELHNKVCSKGDALCEALCEKRFSQGIITLENSTPVSIKRIIADWH